MPSLVTNLILSVSLLAGIVIIAWLVFFVISLSIKRRGQVISSLDMELFLVLIPREASPGEELGDIQNQIQPMEQLFSIFTAMQSKGFWKKWEFGSPTVTWEIVFKDGEIAFYVATPSRYSDTLNRAIHAVFPGAIVEPSEDYDIFQPNGGNAASYVVTSRSSVLPIRTYQSLRVDPLNSIISSLAKLEDGDGAAMQIIMRPAQKGWGTLTRKIVHGMQEGKSFERAFHDAHGNRLAPIRVKNEKSSGSITPQDQEVVNALEAKASQNNFEVNIRLVSSGATQERAEAILSEMESTFSQFNAPNLNYFSEDRERMRQITYEFSFRLFDDKRKIMFSTEELASIFHLPLSGSRLPKIKWLKTRAAPAPWGMNDGIVLGINEYRKQETIVRLAREDRRRHLYVIGQTGTGKTTLLQELIRQDIENGEGVCVIDPHGDLVDSALSNIPQDRWEDVILFDPTDLERPLGLNMLEYNPNFPEQKTFIIDELINIFNKLYDLKTTGGPMFEQYTRNALLLLMDFPEFGYTLMDVPRILADKGFRSQLLARTNNIVVKNFWEKEAEKAGGEAALANMVPYITSKFNIFIANDFMRPIIGQSHNSINFRKIMDEGKILLVSLSKGRLGEQNTSLLGLIMMGKLMLAGFSRVDQAQEERRDFFVYADEFQSFTTSSAATILSEARKYRLNLILAHQFIGQLPEEISDAVFGNVGTMAMLRVGQEDAEFLAQYLAPLFSAHDLINLDNFHAYVKLMLHGQVTQPFNMKLYPPHKSNPETASVVRNISRLKYGTERELVEQEIHRRQSLSPDNLLNKQNINEQSNGADEFKL